MIVLPENSTIKDFGFTTGSKKQMLLNKTTGLLCDIYVKLDGCKVKFLPSKFDRLVIELQQKDIDFLNEFYKELSKTIPFEHFIKNEFQLSVKVTKEYKERVMNELKQKDNITCVILMNELYTMNGKNYLGINLHEFKKNNVTRLTFL